MPLECAGDVVQRLRQPVGAHFGEEREDAARGFGGCLRLGTVPHRMLDGDVGRVQGAIPHEVIAVQEDRLFSPGSGAFVLAEVCAGQAFTGPAVGRA